jgi:hypothetical protein
MEPEPAVALDAVSGTLKQAAGYIRSRITTEHTHHGWRQFLQEDGPPSVTGTACVISTLARMGVATDDSQLRMGTSFITASIRADGGWSKPEFDQHISLTLVSCLALIALRSQGHGPHDPAIDAGLRWLEQAQNTDGGWGCTAGDDRSNVTATAYAIRTLAGQPAFLIGRAAIDRAVEWLLRQRRDTGGWGLDADSSATLAHTSHAVEGLLAGGHPRGDLLSTRAWLCDEVAKTPLTPWIEHYNFTRRHATVLPLQLLSSRLSWTHLPAERSLIALLGLGADPSSALLTLLVRDLEQRYNDHGYWEVQTVPATAPSWAALESVNALGLYLDRMEEAKETIEFRKATRLLGSRVLDLERNRVSILEQLTLVTERLERLETAQKKLQLRTKLGDALRHAVRSRRVRIAAALLITGTISLFYLLFWDRTDSVGTRVVGVATIMAAGTGILALDWFKGKGI